MNTIDLLKEYDEAYELGMPLVSDVQYDVMKVQAIADHPTDPYFKSVGVSRTSNKVRLPHVLGSLNKTKLDDGSYEDWAKDYAGEQLVYWAKLDGCSLFVEYVNGDFSRAMTRGDGAFGTDVTEHARYFVRPHLDELADVELRAEVILTGNHHRDFGYKTRRNGTAGMLNSDASGHCEKLSVMYYELISDDGGLPDTEVGRIDRMTELGLPVAPHTVAKDYTAEQLVEQLATWKSSNAFDIDGVVITPDNSEREDAMYPDNKIAFKVNEEATLCKVVDLEWNVGRTGRVTPVVIIDPMEIGGVTVERATGFNAEFVVESGISAGAIIGIYRSGDVIPYIDFVHEPEYDIYPEECPSCSSVLEMTGVDLVCQSRECPEQNVQIVEHFLRTLGCENVTATTLRKLDVYSVKAAYDLDEFEISMLEGFGIKRAEVICSEIRKTLRTTPDRLLAAFGISGIGKTASQNILKVYDFETLWDLSYDDFICIDGIGETLADNLLKHLPSRKGMYNYLLSEGLKWNSTTNTLRGKVFCLTGNGTVRRDVLVKLIEQNGGYVKGMSKNVDVLVAADPNSTSGKAKKARSYGTDVIGYDELMEMLEY